MSVRWQKTQGKAPSFYVHAEFVRDVLWLRTIIELCDPDFPTQVRSHHG